MQLAKMQITCTIQMIGHSSHLMAGVYCPICEADVEPAAKYCLSCGHDLDVQGPITSTGHDLNQLREVSAQR